MSACSGSSGPAPEELHWTVAAEALQRIVAVLGPADNAFTHPDWKRVIRMMRERNARCRAESVAPMPSNRRIEMVTLGGEDGVIEHDVPRSASLPCAWIARTASVVRGLQ